MITYVKGDLIAMTKEGRFDIILHGCNCFNSMSGGIAATIAKEFPCAEIADMNTNTGAMNKLGSCTVAKAHDNNDVPFCIYNLYTQFQPGANAEYSALRASLRSLKDRLTWGPHAEDGLICKSIGLPWIGAGIGGLDIKLVMQIVEVELGDYDVTMVEYKQN